MRDATDLLRLIGEHVALRPRGREHIGLCPFHEDKNPSMAVVTHKGNAFYKCHSCGAGGDCFDFVMNYHRMDFAEALRLLADKAGIALTPWKRHEGDDSVGLRRIDVKKANAFATEFFRRTLADQRLGAAAREMIAARGISPDIADAFMLGAAPDAWDALSARISRQQLSSEVFIAAGLLKARREGHGHYDAFRNRVMFPICDESGATIAFGARAIDPQDEPKYLNSAESAVFSKSRTLYGLQLAKRAIIERRTAIVTEGYTDVIACHQAGFTNVVATLGTALTADHARMLAKLCEGVILLFDGDEAGMKAADRALAVSFKEGLDIRICVLPDGLDPDELLRQPGGRDRFETALLAAGDLFAYRVARFADTLRGTSVAGKERRLESLMAELAGMGFAAMPGVRQQMLLGRIDDLLRLPLGASKSALARAASRHDQHVNLRAGSVATADSVAAEESRGRALSADVTQARRLAECELLGLIVYEPALALRGFESVAAEQALPTCCVDPSAFADPSCRAIAEFIEQRGPDASFTMQHLLDALPDEEDRRVASRLYFEGQRMAGDEGRDLVPALRAAASALEACRMQERLLEAAAETTQDDPLNRLNQILHHRRQAGRIASAIGRGVRV